MLENEHELVDSARRGQAEAFSALYEHYAAPLYRFIFLKVNNKSTAEDLLHEVFLSAWQNVKRYQYQGAPFSSWLYQIARNKVIDYYRTHKEQTAIDDVSEDQFKLVINFDRGLDDQISMKKVREALNDLSEEQQTVIIMRFVEDLSPTEIAIALDKTEGAVRLLQHRAITNLRKILSDE